MVGLSSTTARLRAVGTWLSTAPARSASAVRRHALDGLWVGLILLAALPLTINVLAPLTGRQLFVIRGDSMEPSIPRGAAVVIVRTPAEDIRAGQAVSLQLENGVVVTHRVQRVVEFAGEPYLEVKGDANPAADPALAPARSAVGVVEVAIPVVGYLLAIASTPIGLLGLLLLAGSAFTAGLLVDEMRADGPSPAAGAPPASGTGKPRGGRLALRQGLSGSAAPRTARTGAGPGPWVGLVAILLAVGVVTPAAGASAALLGDSAAVGANDFATAACFRAQGAAVQRGTATSSANGTVTVAITSVDTTKSFLLFSSRHNNNRPVGSLIRGRLASATSLEFVRVTNESPVSTMTIEWAVVSYACGINVQRGSVTQASTTINVSIAAVAGLDRAFVTWSKTPASADGTWSDDDPIVGELTSTSNLQFRVVTAASAHIIWWQVIEFPLASDIKVQKGSTSLTGTSLTSTVTIPTAVDTSRTFVLVGFRTSGSGADVGARMLRAQLSSSTSITIDRSVSGSPDSITEIVWQAVELNDGSAVQGGSEPFASGVSQKTVSLSPITLGRATAFASVQSGDGQSMGRSSYVTDDITGVGSFTGALSANQLTLDRANTAAGADVGWFVVEWAP
jgi:signal peptidase I